MKYVCTMYLCVFIRVFIYVHTYRTYVCAQCSEHFAVCRLLCVFLWRSSAPPLHTHSSPLALSLLCVRAALLQVCFHRYLFLIFLAFSLDVQRFFSFSLFLAFFPPLPILPCFAYRSSLHFFFFFFFSFSASLFSFTSSEHHYPSYQVSIFIDCCVLSPPFDFCCCCCCCCCFFFLLVFLSCPFIAAC